MNKDINQFLAGNFAPWRSEGSFVNLEIIGKIPEDLNGVLLRNGPNPQFDPVGQYHWFEGDGMLHAIRIENGRASYDNKWVRTERFKLENKACRALFNSGLGSTEHNPQADHVSSNTANTNIVFYNDQLLALNEGASPVGIKLDNLETIGDYTYDGQIMRNLTAHPRYDYKKQELMTYSYTNMDEQLVYYRLDKNNKLIAEKVINWPYPAMMHDFINTENYVIFPIFPCTLSLSRMQKGEPVFMWEGDRLNTVFIITDRIGDEIARLETNPCYVYHFGNAYESGNNVIIDAMLSKCAALMPDRRGNVPQRGDVCARLARLTINIKDKIVNTEYLDERIGEFPRFDERFNGYPYQHLYAGGRKEPDTLFDRITHYNLHTKHKKEHLFGDDVPSEPVFVPRSLTEGDGYLLTVVYRAKEDRSDVVILDASNIKNKPLAVIKLPHRVPYGFHGNFISQNDL